MPGCVNTKFKSNAPGQAFAVADEPLAAAVGRDLLTQGGSAVDAAAGMALAMTATLPSRVGLGGGGVCVVFDAAARRVRTLDFLPRAGTPGGTAAPGLPRALYALHAAGGTLRWEQVAVPTETLARTNPGISRALAQDLQAGAARLTDAEARRIFLPGGRAPAEGAPLSQPELTSVLSQLRRTGANGFYTGGTAQALAAAFGLDPAALRGVQAQWRETVPVRIDGTRSLHLADLPEPESGAAIAKAWAAAEKAPPAERAARAAQALGAMAGTAAPGAGLIAMDVRENAVACAFTMGGLFGTGRAAPGTGVLGGLGIDRAGFGAPGVVANTIVGRALFGGVGTASGTDGSAAGAAALLAGALPALLDDRPAPEILAARGGDAPGRVDLVTCQVSMDSGQKDCQTAADPRAHGIAYDLLLPRE